MRPGAIDGRVRVWFNPELESRDFMVPGVLALLLLVITANLSSMAIVRERELGTLEQLNVTPLGRWELILGKLLPYALIGFIDVLLVMARGGALVRGAAARQRRAAARAAACVYLLCTLGLGLFVSTISSTQQQAMMTSTFFFLVPMIYLSGFIFPIENMPRVIQWVTTLIPLRYFLVIVRGIFLKGVGFDVLWPQFAALAAWGIAVLVARGVRSSKRSQSKRGVRLDAHARSTSARPATTTRNGAGRSIPRSFRPRRCSAYYAERFRTVEINYTFYRMPTEKTTTAWREQAPPGFTYTLKAPRRITHDQRLPRTRRTR